MQNLELDLWNPTKSQSVMMDLAGKLEGKKNCLTAYRFIKFQVMTERIRDELRQ